MLVCISAQGSDHPAQNKKGLVDVHSFLSKNDFPLHVSMLQLACIAYCALSCNDGSYVVFLSWHHCNQNESRLTELMGALKQSVLETFCIVFVGSCLLWTWKKQWRWRYPTSAIEKYFQDCTCQIHKGQVGSDFGNTTWPIPMSSAVWTLQFWEWENQRLQKEGQKKYSLQYSRFRDESNISAASQLYHGLPSTSSPSSWDLGNIVLWKSHGVNL